MTRLTAVAGQKSPGLEKVDFASVTEKLAAAQSQASRALQPALVTRASELGQRLSATEGFTLAAPTTPAHLSPEAIRLFEQNVRVSGNPLAPTFSVKGSSRPTVTDHLWRIL